MVNGARPSANARDIVDGICRRLCDAGIPIERFILFVYTLHPNLMGRRFRWQPGVDVDMAEAPVSTTGSFDYKNNPLPHVLENQASIRRKLCDKNCQQDYLIVEQLRGEELTDYLIQPLIFTTGETHACSWSTKQEGGFSDEMIEIFEKVAPPLARLSEIYMLRLNAANTFIDLCRQECWRSNFKWSGTPRRWRRNFCGHLVCRHQKFHIPFKFGAEFCVIKPAE